MKDKRLLSSSLVISLVRLVNHLNKRSYKETLLRDLIERDLTKSLY